MTLNLLCQSKTNPDISAWEAFNGIFSYNHTQLGPLGCRVIIHKKNVNRYSWDYRGQDGWGCGVAMHHYRCQNVIAHNTKAAQVSDIVEFRHHHITQPSLTSDGRVLHGMQTLTGALKNSPIVACDAQFIAITELRDALQGWSGDKDIIRAQLPSKVPHALLPRVRRQKLSNFSKKMRARRDIPKEESPTIALPIDSPVLTPSAPPPRVMKQCARESPRRSAWQPQPNGRPISGN